MYATNQGFTVFMTNMALPCRDDMQRRADPSLSQKKLQAIKQVNSSVASSQVTTTPNTYCIDNRTTLQGQKSNTVNKLH